MAVDEDEFCCGIAPQRMLADEFAGGAAGGGLGGDEAGLGDGRDIGVAPFFLVGGGKAEFLEGVDAMAAEGVDPGARGLGH